MERKEFHDPSQWEFTSELESNWEVIRDEFDALNTALLHPWPELNLFEKQGQRGQGWDVFGLYAFGKRHSRNTRLCPRTTAIVERIPGCSTAAFSVLAAGAKILPHVGYYGYSEMVLRCHLGIRVPTDGDCYLQVAERRQGWTEGRCFVFDDTFTHLAVNSGSTDRVVLLLDFTAGPLPAGGGGRRPDDGQADQTGYLDRMTAQYGYGVPDDSDATSDALSDAAAALAAKLGAARLDSSTVPAPADSAEQRSSGSAATGDADRPRLPDKTESERSAGGGVHHV